MHTTELLAQQFSRSGGSIIAWETGHVRCGFLYGQPLPRQRTLEAHCRRATTLCTGTLHSVRQYGHVMTQ